MKMKVQEKRKLIKYKLDYIQKSIIEDDFIGKKFIERIDIDLLNDLVNLPHEYINHIHHEFLEEKKS